MSPGSGHVTLPPSLIVAIGSVIGSLTILLFLEKKSQQRCTKHSSTSSRNNDPFLQDKRQRLPSLILLLRHAESEGNADHTLWRTKPDNLISLTEKGYKEAIEAGKRIETIFQIYDKQHPESGDRNSAGKTLRVHIHVSPFERTLQTARAARQAFEHRVVRTSPESRIREQEFGNFSLKDSLEQRQEQQQVGRFWYRFPTGESGADVYDRVKSWWCESVLTINERIGYEPVDAVVVVTHSLSMRFVLMQLYNWSPLTFHSVWAAQSCELYVLRKDMSLPGIDPYVLDDVHGDMPRSSIDVYVRLRKYENDDTTDDSTTSSSATSSSTSIIKLLRLHNYLNIPPPRTIQFDLIKEQLMEQYPHEIQSIDDIESISFKPIMHMPESFDTALVDKDSTISVNNQPQKSGFDCNKTGSRSQLGGENHEPLEKSFRWPRTCTKSSSTT